MTPGSSGGNNYKSKYWPGLNGVADDSAPFSASWAQKTDSKSERENILLDIIGAYDLLVQQGLSAEGASIRLGLRKSRDELVQELDSETTLRLSIPIQPPPGPPRKFAR